ncbi:PREDICTED: cadherin-87A-like [Priapulus caudatus]|uniref:Cadherin-87A-like n=1 Tax=Priapulus caudatus TaxID=37621 RepID=A0ABM1F3W1_PRICU|nr:PREDICTED: cadherin-87A-like [Priapulus caudatus]
MSITRVVRAQDFAVAVLFYESITWLSLRFAELAVIVFYEVVIGDPEERFRVDVTHTGDSMFIQSKDLDRELYPHYNVIVKAHNCVNRTDRLETDVDYSATDLTLLLVRVNVLDINDQAPVFVNTIEEYEAEFNMTSVVNYKDYVSGIKVNSHVGSIVSEQVKAIDEDLPPNNHTQYSIGQFVGELNYNYWLEEDKRPPFVIDPDTGAIKLNHSPKPNAQGLWRFIVTATDPPLGEGPHSTNATVWQGNYDDEEEQTLEKTLKLALIIVCIILPVIVITLICIWCSEVNK